MVGSIFIQSVTRLDYSALHSSGSFVGFVGMLLEKGIASILFRPQAEGEETYANSMPASLPPSLLGVILNAKRNQESE